MPTRRSNDTWALMVVALAAIGCTPQVMPPALPIPPGPDQVALPAVAARVSGISVRSTPDMNGAMALMLDIVFLFDSQLLTKLPNNAPAWFVDRRNLTFQYAGLLEILSLEMTVSDCTGVIPVSERQRHAAAVVAYANYVSEVGQVRANISVYRCPTLSLMSNGMVLSEGHVRRRLFAARQEMEVPHEFECAS